MVGEGKKVGLPRPPWADQENVVLLWASNRCRNTGQHVFHYVVTPHEESFQRLAIHVSWAIA